MHPFYLFSHFIAYFSSKLTYNRCKELVVSELYYKQNNPPNPQRLEGLFMTCCPRRIRTTTDRTKTVVLPLHHRTSKSATKVVDFSPLPNIFNTFNDYLTVIKK